MTGRLVVQMDAHQQQSGQQMSFTMREKLYQDLHRNLAAQDATDLVKTAWKLIKNQS